MIASGSTSQPSRSRRAGRHARKRRGIALRSMAMVAIATGAFVVVGIAPEAHAAGSMTVTPSTNLASDGTTMVEVQATGLPGSTEVFLQQCRVASGDSTCVTVSNDDTQASSFTTNPDGSLDVTVDVSYLTVEDMGCDTDLSQPQVTGCKVTIVNGTTPAPVLLNSALINFAGHTITSAPDADLVVTPATGPVPLDTSLDASGSAANDSPISYYIFDFGDGSPPDQTESATDTHTYPEAGQWLASVSVYSEAGTFSTASQTVVVTNAAPPPPTATKVVFGSQPVDTMVNQPMSSAVQVLAKNADGTTDTTDNGTALLTLGGGTAGAHFVGGGTIAPSGTVISQPFVQGVATFTGIAVDTVGFRYTLTASSGNLTQATSNLFDVASNATVCPAGQSCTVSASSPATGQSAVVTAAPGPGAIVTASFGGNVAPLHGCTTTAPGILTFNGNRQKTIKLTIATNRLILKFCYGQPTPFTDITLRKTTFFNTANQEYEGILGPCLGRLIPPPCISALSVSRGSETVTVIGGAGDPRMSH